MAQTDCTWHLLVFRVSVTAYRVLAWRYADGLFQWARIEDDCIYLEPLPDGEFTNIFAYTPIHQYLMPPHLRAHLRALLDKVPCPNCRCSGCVADRQRTHIRNLYPSVAE